MEIIFLIVIFALIGLYLVTLNKCKKTKTRLASEMSTKIKENDSLNSKLERFNRIVSIEDEIELKNKELSSIQNDATELNDKFIQAKKIFNELEKDIKTYENDLEFVEYGIYEPVFDLDSSEDYKQKIKENKEKQKYDVKNGHACICTANWTVEGSVKKGEVMTRRYINLTLRAFNGECDSLISKVKWNNITRFEERIEKSFNAINKLGKSNAVYITDSYLSLKLEELGLVHELALKKQQEKEQARAIREEQREEERAIREMEKARKDAEAEEKRYQKALEKARKDLGLVSGGELDKLNAQIQQLEQNLKDAHDSKERAISMAQQTKSGHVYIISNLGSFGANIYKIGMTRRLEPMDRVRELGDASVPFSFDVHAMIYSDNAPELEKLLHREFSDKRVNLVNNRKEYFNVTLEDIEKVIKEKFDSEIEFIKIPEAQQFRETQQIIKNKNVNGEEKIEKYPENLF